jgi:choline-glycine betaine transporter
MLWASVIGVVAVALLIGGVLDTLQTGAIITGQPITGASY